MDSSGPDRPRDYEILVEGKLDRDWSDWFDALSVTVVDDVPGSPITRLAGPLADQSELRGILNRIWDLNLVVLSVHRLE